jgi:hypothetical protein
MASAQVQHDGRVIGSLVAPRFSTLREAAFRCTNRTRTHLFQRHLRSVRRGNRTSFHALSRRLPSRNGSRVLLHLALYFLISSHCSKQLTQLVFVSIVIVKNSLKQSITEFSVILPISNKMFQPEINRLYCQIHAALRKETPTHRNWNGGSTVTNVAILSRD